MASLALGKTAGADFQMVSVLPPLPGLAAILACPQRLYSASLLTLRSDTTRPGEDSGSGHCEDGVGLTCCRPTAQDSCGSLHFTWRGFCASALGPLEGGRGKVSEARSRERATWDPELAAGWAGRLNCGADLGASARGSGGPTGGRDHSAPWRQRQRRILLVTPASGAVRCSP